MKKISFISAVSIGLLSISLAAASPSDAVGQIRQNATQVLSILKGGDADGCGRGKHSDEGPSGKHVGSVHLGNGPVMVRQT